MIERGILWMTFGIVISSCMPGSTLAGEISRCLINGKTVFSEVPCPGSLGTENEEKARREERKKAIEAQKEAVAADRRKKEAQYAVEAESRKRIAAGSSLGGVGSGSPVSSRPNDLEELCKDFVYYKAKAYKHGREGDQKAAEKARNGLAKVNAWLSQYPDAEVGKTCAKYDTAENLTRYMR